MGGHVILLVLSCAGSTVLDNEAAKYVPFKRAENKVRILTLYIKELDMIFIVLTGP